ncbi:hypothetical protein Gasu2_52680 [Galdieria sulphuraria]|uniref:Peptidyl-prolyl cis-trans isomerase n=1 Tax=Galdieria sulphuraria TaxID=130081 RepID=M2XUD0_GALSU|nr:peptidyl-prolyl cis-trans isomerase isoform 1 [Galdieria sulphuraria]EME27024.1 peptidyl-prolyl cis-trans isomerase isoform 1 [Galdieria sulphuraria]GJD11121.1 hypothetical protein Gasu2_52680 [Galdieria sulphuraria]|eukprot:XP_005703544.1 peptidyl-prolyl cis-trans isomerase isoform 1 [Galdieria sulphuraria]
MGNVLRRTAKLQVHTPTSTDIVAVKVRHILLPNEKLLQQCEEQIQKGKSFAAVAREFSACPSSSRGGDLGWVPRGSLQKDFEAACLSAKENQLQSVKTTFGFHLFLVEAKKTKLSFEQPTQPSTQVSEALRLLSGSIVTRTVPEAHPSWALKSKKEIKTGPKDRDSEKAVSGAPGFLTEKELDQLFVRWKNDPKHWNPAHLAQEYSLDIHQVHQLLCYTGVWSPQKDRDGKVRGYLCSQFLSPSSFEKTYKEGKHREDTNVSRKRDISQFSNMA